ncbi:MAG: hypothetical protein GX851_04085 [Clostridiales bacterium]|nr:hypothetical protein [Clostridiales bacterium]
MRFEIKGIRFKLSWTFFAALTLMLVYSGDSGVLVAVICAMLHETGHIVCLYALSGCAASIELGVFGMRLVRREETKLSYAGEVLCALGGPVVNILLSVLFSVLYVSGMQSFARAAKINLALGLFNLMPVGELDGGRALTAFLCTRFSPVTAERIMLFVSVAVLLPVSFAGFYVLIDSGYNFTLLIAAVYIALNLVLRIKQPP